MVMSMSKPMNAVVLTIVVWGCATGAATYTPPAPVPAPPNTITIERSRSDLWRALVPAIGRTFFVINNLDQSSGLINVSFSGSPETYLDCGRIVSNVSDGTEKHTYAFPAARAQERYPIVTGTGLKVVERSISLEGRVNLILEDVSATLTRLTVNVRYVVTRQIRVAPPAFGDAIDVISFSSSGRATFPGDDPGTTCQATGALEKEVLALVNSP